MGIRVREKGHVQGRFAYRFGVMRWNGDKYEIPDMKYFSKKHMELLDSAGKAIKTPVETADEVLLPQVADHAERVSRLSATVREVPQEEGSAV